MASLTVLTFVYWAAMALCGAVTEEEAAAVKNALKRKGKTAPGETDAPKHKAETAPIWGKNG